MSSETDLDVTAKSAEPPAHALLRTPRRLSASTWALHALIGTVAPGRPGDPAALLMTPPTVPASPLRLVDVPQELAARGIRTMELCHFHLESRDTAYLAELRSAREAAGVELWNLLVDDGDITDPVNGDRDTAWTREWMEVADALGARCVRVVGGKQPPTPENRAVAAKRMNDLASDADRLGLHLVTENWFPILSRPEYVVELLDAAQGAIGLNLDFGNWGGATKYEDLAAIAPYAVGCHAKCNFVDGVPDVDDYRRCLEITRDAGYSGPYSIVYGAPADVWSSIDQQLALLVDYVAA
jgi:sugar phosphate isomerase/epimerase